MAEFQTLTTPTTKADAAHRLPCTACGADDATDFFTLDRLPVHVGVFYDTKDQARRAPMGELTLSFCRRCGFIYNRQFDAKITTYEPGYQVALHHSPVFRNFILGVAERLIDRFDLHGKSIFEIGAGDGFFLRQICEMGGNNGIGVDPTVVTEGEEQIGDINIKLIRDFFGGHLGSVFESASPDFVCCLSVFEGIPDPAVQLTALRRMIGDRPVPIYFEVFNGLRSFEKGEVWSVHYEQCNYFSLNSLAPLFRRCGFDVIEASTCYDDDQYLYVEAVPGDMQVRKADSADVSHIALPDGVRRFAENRAARSSFWQEKLAEFEQQGDRVVVWGTGGKGISFLNAFDTGGVIEYAVEINPDKHGRFVPGSGQEIVAPEFLVDYQPSKIVITNPLYEKEMKGQANGLGLNAEFLIV